MNWEHFQTYNEAATRGFEAMCNQLFELWCKREYLDRIIYFTTVNGSGGDGGVEAYAVLDNKDIIAVQSKWFRESMEESQLNQIKGSIITAKTIRPAIKRYIVCIPHDLSSKKMGRGKKGGAKKPIENSEEDRWNTLKLEINTRYNDLEIILWNESRIMSELQNPEAEGVYRYWFEKSEISIDLLKNSFEKQKNGWLNQRYIPTLHSKGTIDVEIQKLVGTISKRENSLINLRKIRTIIENTLKELEDYISDIEIKNIKYNEIEKFKNLFSILQNKYKNILILIDATTFAYAPQSLSMAEKYINYEDFISLIEEQHKENYSIKNSDLKNKLKKLSDKNIDDQLQESSHELFYSNVIILGDPGTGKTHGLADAVKDFVENKELPALLIQAKSVVPSQTWKDIIINTLGLSGHWSEDEIWTALESLAFRCDVKRTKRGKESTIVENENTKVLICIDGIDESRPWDKWFDRIGEFGVISSKHSRLRLCISSRTYVFNKICKSSNEFKNIVKLPDDGDVSAYKLFPSYIKAYNIQIGESVWIQWSLRTPLALKLFCEIYQNDQLSNHKTISTTITKLIEKKIQRIDDEFRKSHGEKWSEKDYIIWTSITTLALYFYSNREISRKNICKIIIDGHPRNLLTEELAGNLIDYLENYGLLQSYLINPQDIFSLPTIYYEASIQPIFDYLFALNFIKEINNNNTEKLPQRLVENKGAQQMAAIIMLEDYNILVAYDELWRKEFPIDQMLDLVYFALSNVSPEITEKYKQNIEKIMSNSMPHQRKVISKLVARVARIENHPLGPMFLHQHLMNYQCVADRDILWSVPEVVFGNPKAKWNGIGYYALNDDEFCLINEDKHNGLPLLYAWSLTIVDNKFRVHCRKELTRWGSINPKELINLLILTYETNDPQMKEDLVCIAYGVACLINRDNEVLKELAEWAIEEIFNNGKIENTKNVVVRYAGRAIVERAYACKHIDFDCVSKVRPPYNIGEGLIEMDLEAATCDREGFRPITSDLAWYVIKKAYEDFFKHVDVQQNEEESGLNTIADYLYTKEIKELLSNRINEINDTTLESLIEVVSSNQDSPDIVKIEYYPEAEKFLKEHANNLGIEKINPHQFAVSASIAYLKKLGWNKKDFYGNPNGGKPGEILGIDVAIMRKYYPATHGSQSTVMQFCEKYVWCSIHEILGYLADRLLFSYYGEELSQVDDYSLMLSIPNPAQELLQENPDLIREDTEIFMPNELSPSITGLDDSKENIIKWINEANIPEFNNWILMDTKYSVQVNPDIKGDWVCLYNFTSLIEPVTNSETLLWISACISTETDFKMLIKDIENGVDEVVKEFNNPEDIYSSTKSSTYITPSEICWMDWKKDLYSKMTNITLSDGVLKEYTIEKTIEKAVYDSVEYGELYFKLPSKKVRKLLEITDGDGRRFINIQGNLKAFYLEAGGKWRNGQILLYVDKDELFRVLEKEGKMIFWVIRLTREPSLKAKEKYDDFHFYRDRNWIVWYEKDNLEAKLFIDTGSEIDTKK